MSTSTISTGTGADRTATMGWRPVGQAGIRHILTEVGALEAVPESMHPVIAEHVLVPHPPTVHFANQGRSLGAIDLMLLTVSALRVCRGMPPTTGSMSLGFVLAGSVTIASATTAPVTLKPGAGFAINDWSGFDAETTAGTRCLQVVLPEAALADRGVRTRGPRFLLDGSRSLRAPLRDFALSIVDAAWRGSSVGELVAGRAIEDLTVGMFLEADGYAMDGDDLRAGLRGRAITEIERSHRDATLRPAGVAERLAVSLRHLQRAFTDSGESIAHAIAERRAKSAALLLVAPGADTLTVEEIAARSGFTSAFELRAAFRASYGVLPSEFRARHPGSNSVPEEREFRAAATATARTR